MVFSSTEFLFIFLPLFLLAHGFLPYKNLTYALFSLVFYFAGEGWYSVIVITSVVVNYGFGLAIDRQEGVRGRKIALAAGLTLNLLSLFFFKYAGFFWKDVLRKHGDAWITSIHLPLGISFFTFHSISYLIDIYRRDARAERSFVNLSLYMLMFPQLIAGPILRFHTVADQLRRRVVTARHIHFGFLLFCIGLGQKVLIADTLATVVDPLFAPAAKLTRASAWIATISYSFQILFDFSGYSNMAVGLGYVTGFSLPRNFDAPYSSQSITEFWRRWHMSLSRWFRDYFYLPLGGNRHGALRTYRNLLIVFLTCGLWHGASWTFVIWGAYHGMWLVIERLGWGRVLERLPRVVRHVYAMLVVLVGWVLFRADSLEQTESILGKMFRWGQPPEAAAGDILGRGQLLALVCAILLCIPPVSRTLGRALRVVSEGPLPESVAPRVYALGVIVSLLVFGAAAMNILAGAYSSFIYFRF
jgi:alginate O-acetyltransferase complex protein AlgI